MEHPYVTPTEFRAWPTFLDSNNLRLGDSQAAQDAALDDVLMTASAWADEEVNMPLGAHRRVEASMVRADSRGRMRYHPEHAPVISIEQLEVGGSPDSLDTVTDPQVWTEQDGRIITAFTPGAPGLASLQFGTPPPNTEMLARWTYTAGYPCTQLAAAAAAAASSIEVLDALGIQVGTVLRIWTPDAREAVTVAAVVGTTLVLSAPLQAAHVAGISCSALPPTARLAVMKFAMAKLMRSGPAAENAGRYGISPSATSKDPKRQPGGGHSLVEGACRLLATFQRVR